jgi:hypothetical protein
MKSDPSGIWIKLPLSPKTVALAAEHAERIAVIVDKAPALAHGVVEMLGQCAEVLGAVEKVLVRATAPKRRKKLPRAKRRRK